MISVPPGGASANLGLLFIYGASSNDSWKGEYLSGAISVYDGLGAFASQGYSVNSGPNGLPATIDPVSQMNIVTNTIGVGLGTTGASGSITYGTTVTDHEWLDYDWPSSVPLVLPNNPYSTYNLFPW